MNKPMHGRKWIMAILIGIGTLFSGPAAAEWCVENGGDYVGCVKPSGFRWETPNAGHHSTLMGALRAQAKYDISQRPNPHFYTMGLQTAPHSYTPWTTSCTPLNVRVEELYSGPDRFFNRQDGVNAKVSFRVHIHGFYQKYSCPHLKDYYKVTGSAVYGKPICPVGYTAREEFPDTAENYGYMCVPGQGTEMNLAAVSKNNTFSCQDTVGQAGQSKTGMPVDIGTRCKTEAAVDLSTQGPWPVQWARYTALQSERESWRMGEVGNLQETSIRSGFSWVVLRRPWGQYLTFKATPVSGGARTWNTGMESPQLFQSQLFDVWSGGALQHWILKQANGEHEMYASNGKLVRRISSDGFQHHYQYDSKGRLASISDDFGHHITVGYGTNIYDQTDTISWENEAGDPLSENSSYTNDPLKALSEYIPQFVTDGTRSVGYSWTLTAAGENAFHSRLTHVLWDDNSVREYKYGELVNGKTMGNQTLSGVVDEEGRRIRTYEPVSNGSPLILREWTGAGPDGVGALRRLTINTSSVVDQDGRSYSFTKGGSSTQSEYRIKNYSTPCPECGGVQGSAITYNSAGLITLIKDWRNTNTAFTYDTAGRVLTVTQAQGTPLARTTTYTYDSDPSVREPLTVQRPVRNALGVLKTHTTTYHYTNVAVTYGSASPCSSASIPCASTARKLTSIVESVDDGSISRTTTIAYNTYGLQDTVTAPTGAVTKWTWTGDGQVATVTTSYGTAAAHTITFGGHGVWGPSWQHDGNGLTTRWARDVQGRIVQEEVGIVGPNGIGVDNGDGTWSTTDGQWRTSHLQWMDNNLLERAIASDGTRLEFTYDGADQVTQIVAKNSSDVLLWSKTLTYSPAGLLLSSVTKNASGATVLSDATQYNALQQVSKMLSSTSAETVLGYNANGELTSTQTPLLHSSSQSPDVLGRPTTFTNALSHMSEMTYGPSDEVLSAKDPRNVTTNYTYNGFGDLVSIASPDRGTWTFAYNNAGQHTSTTDPRGVVQTFTHDAAGRVTVIDFEDAGVTGSPAGFAAGDATQIFSYDSCSNGMGRLCSFTDGSGSTALTYNTWGDLTSSTWVGKAGGPASGVTLSTGYGYNLTTGQRLSTLMPSGKTVLTTYGHDGRPSQQSYDGQSFVGDIAWTPWGDIQGWTWAQSVGWSGTHAGVEFVYDTDGRVDRITDLDDRDLVWDNDNRLVGVDSDDVNYSQAYTYDALNQLTGADVGIWGSPQTYSYDAAGNRLSHLETLTTNGTSFAYGASNNRLISRSNVLAGVPGTALNLSYDAMGNVVSDGLGGTYSYDVTGRMVQASNGAVTVHATYNALGQRMTKHVVGGATAGTSVYMYDDARRPLGVYAIIGSSASVKEEYLHLDGWRVIGVARPHPSTGMSNPQLFPVLSDHLGTPRKVLDGATGVTRWAWDAKEPFGHELPNSNPSGLGTFELNLRFPGQVFDVETGLFHNGHRDYHAKLGRYVQSDPLGLEAGWNTYAYVGGNPVSGVDPLGLKVVFTYLPPQKGRAGGLGPKAVNVSQIYANDLYRTSPTFRMMFDYLDSSPRTYKILAMGPPNENSIGFKEGWQAQWNMGRTVQCGDGRVLPLGSGLAHEVGHLYLLEQKIRRGETKMRTGLVGKWHEEGENLELERRIHEEMGWVRGRSRAEYFWGNDTPIDAKDTDMEHLK